MHDLFILFGSLGGIAMFGILGIIIGPIVAALFITIWEIYGKAFKEYLPEVKTVLLAHKYQAAESGILDENPLDGGTTGSYQDPDKK